MADTTPKSYSADPTLYLYTSLTAGSSHIITATSRLDTILKANKIAFRALDVATDEKARMLWGRRSKGKKLPGLVKFGTIVGDLEQIEEWNEYGELKQQIGATGPVTASTPATSASTTPSKAPAATIPVSATAPKDVSDTATPSASPIDTKDPIPEAAAIDSSRKEETPLTKAMRQAGAEAARKAGEKGGSMTKAPPSVKGGEAPKVQVPVIEAGRSKSVEDPSASAEITAAKTPEKLAEEGAERTSVGKIAEEATKRAEEDQDVTSVENNDPQPADPIKEATAIHAARASSVPKFRSPLSEDVTPESIIGEQFRGDTIVSASKDTIQATEKRMAIAEEDEPQDQSTTGPSVKPTTTTFNARSEAETASETAVKTSISDLAASDESELAATKGVQPQDKDAKDGEEAGTSVGD